MAFDRLGHRPSIFIIILGSYSVAELVEAPITDYLLLLTSYGPE